MRTLTICGRTIADYAIVLKSVPNPAEKTAAEFLQRVIELSCGVKLPVSENAEYGIYLGTRDADLRVKWDGYRITTDDCNLYLDGNIPRGTLYAAYDFAEKYLGYRYFAPDCELFGSEGEADVPAGLDRVDNPAFEVRRSSNVDHFSHAEGFVHARMNSSSGCDLTPYGGEAYVGIPCHTFFKYCSGKEYFEEHPEYFALHGGERIPCNDGGGPGQLCLTNPDVLRIVTENVLKELREHPETTLIDLSQCDNHNFCQCDACRSVDEEEGSHAGTMIRFVNAVAEEVEKEFPHVMVQTFAYEYSRVPPKFTKARHNVMVRYCTIEACFRHALNDPNCEKNGPIYGDELEKWQKKADQLSIWDYTTNFNCFIGPFPNLRALFHNIRFLADCHATHIYGEGDCYGQRAGGAYVELKAYLLGKLYWNPYMSEEEYDRHINEFLAGFYGPGWQEIRRYIELEHDTTAHRHITCFQDVDIALAWYSNEPFVRDLRYHLRRIYELHPNQPVYPDHVFTELCEHMDEIKAMWDKAYELAETESQRMHLDRSRMTIRYMELAMIPHYWGTLSEEEQAAHDADVEKFLEDKKKYALHYNILTSGLPGKRRR